MRGNYHLLQDSMKNIERRPNNEQKNVLKKKNRQ